MISESHMNVTFVAVTSDWKGQNWDPHMYVVLFFLKTNILPERIHHPFALIPADFVVQN